MDPHSPNSDSDIHNARISDLQDAGLTHPPLGPDDPQTPFPSALLLNRQQEDALVKLAMDQLQAMDEESGRTRTDSNTVQYGDEWFAAPFDGDPATNKPLQETVGTFFGKRAIYELIWQNKMAWRRSVIGGVFATVNLTLSTARRIASQRIARFNRYFFESRPWWNADPQKSGATKEFSRHLAKWCDWKLHESGSVSELSMSIVRAAVVGEAILKTTSAVDDEFYREELEVCIDSNGEPIVASDGDYLYRDDLWMPAPLDPIAAAQSAAAEMNAGEAPPMMEVLERDQQTTRAGNIITVIRDGLPVEIMHSTYDTRLLDRRTVHYQGARTKLVYYRDFMCPLGAPDVHSAKCIVHLYDIDASELAQAYAQDASEDTIRQAVEMITNAVSGDGYNTAAADVSRPRASIGETIDTRTVNDATPLLHVGEFYIKCDPDGSGITRDIMLIVDITTQTPIYYNYTAVASPTRRRPFRIVRECPVEGRWFGQGTIERFYDHNNLIDLFLCRAALNQSRSGRIDFFAPHNTVEGLADPHLRVSWGGTYTLKQGITSKDQVLQSAYLEDNKSNELRYVLQIFQQAATNESGTANTNDAAAAGLDSQDTATGINNIAAAGNELTALPIYFLRIGLEQALADFVITTFRFHDETETHYYFDGEAPVELRIPHRDVRNLTVNVTITLTSMANERDLPKKRAAIADANDYYDRVLVDPARGPRLAPLYQDVLQNEGVENAAAVIVAPDPSMMMAPAGMPQTQTASL